MDYKAQKIQTALFIQGLNISGYNKYEFVGQLKTELGDFFDGEPVVMPLPDDAPPLIPRIILTRKDRKLSCNISLSRADIFSNLEQKEDENLEEILEEQREILIKIFNFLETKNVKISRLGFVVTFLTATEDNDPPGFLRKIFFKDEDYFERALELQINYLKKEDEIYNHSIRIGGEKDQKLLLQIDINTIPNEKNFNKEKIDEILDYSVSKIKYYFEKYNELE